MFRFSLELGSLGLFEAFLEAAVGEGGKGYLLFQLSGGGVGCILVVGYLGLRGKYVLKMLMLR